MPITDELGNENYGCETQEIQTQDFKETKKYRCMPAVDSLRITHTLTEIGLVTLTFRVETRSCTRNRDKVRGVVVVLELSQADRIQYKVVAIATKRALHTRADMTTYNLTVALSNKGGLFIVRVAAIRTPKDTPTFIPPYSVGVFEEHNTYYETDNPKIVSLEHPFRCKLKVRSLLLALLKDNGTGRISIRCPRHPPV
ncbi:uncharacterized protein [Argopecten irradians]|uniref:uncharacterized protein isoform X2 n=1 Tax=Argopecten irradians TaxID=31199 RepID=UPI003713071C